MSVREELPLLKSRAQALRVRLDRLNHRIGDVQQGSRVSLAVAVVDSEKCLGCGVCETACPAGAIAVKDIAFVNPGRCIGCGRCICECPQGAIRLHPAILHEEGKPRRRLELKGKMPIRTTQGGKRGVSKKRGVSS